MPPSTTEASPGNFSTQDLSTPYTVWVKPRQTPSTMSELFPIPLPGTDRINFEITYTNTLPGPLDTTRLIAAFQDALTYYPHASGRLRIEGSEWSIKQGMRGVPLTFAHTEEPFNHYANLEAAPAHLVDTCMRDISGAKEASWDESLVTAKVTYCRKTGETYIGWSSSHMIGDGEFVYQFLYAWSRYYQGKEPIFGPPTYEKFRSEPPAFTGENEAAFIDKHLPHLKVLYPTDEWMGMVGDAMGRTAQVDLMFTKWQIEQLQAVAGLHPRTRGASAQDAVSAYVITTLNRILDVPIRRVASMLSYRGVPNPPDLKPTDWRIPGKLALGNAIFQTYTSHLSADEATSLGAVALVIRQSLKDTRNYEHIKRIVAVSEPIWLRQSTEGKEHKFWHDEGCFVINSMPKVNLAQLHFGYGAARTRIVMYGSFAGFARFFQAPPVQLPDGKWESNEGAMVMSVRIPTDIKDKFLARVAEDFILDAFPQNLMWREREALGRGKEKARL